MSFFLLRKKQQTYDFLRQVATNASLDNRMTDCECTFMILAVKKKFYKLSWICRFFGAQIFQLHFPIKVFTVDKVDLANGARWCNVIEMLFCTLVIIYNCWAVLNKISSNTLTAKFSLCCCNLWSMPDHNFVVILFLWYKHTC